MLNKIKQILRSDNASVLIGNLLASAFGLGTFMLLARGLSKSEFGAWALFVSASGLLDLMRTGLVRQGMVRALTVAKSTNQHHNILASGGILAICISTISALIIGGVFMIFDTSAWSLNAFFQYYPAFALISLPSSFDTWKSHAEGRFKRMNAIRLMINMLFIVGVGLGTLWTFSFSTYLWVYLGSQGAVSVFSMFSLIKIDWKQVSKSQLMDLMNFGKHSLATLAGANLLKSADSLLIGAFLGKEAVAIYAIPLKALDLMEIPLRGFVMTSFRKLSRYFEEKQFLEFNNHLWSHVKRLTLIFLPGAIVMLIIPSLFIQVLGGKGYESSRLILMIMTVPMILMPLEKYVGMSFDSINLPKMNAMKVWLMVILNVLGDVVALYFFQSLTLVAVVTIANILFGIGFGLINQPYLRWPSSFKPLASSI